MFDDFKNVVFLKNKKLKWLVMVTGSARKMSCTKEFETYTDGPDGCLFGEFRNSPVMESKLDDGSRRQSIDVSIYPELEEEDEDSSYGSMPSLCAVDDESGESMYDEVAEGGIAPAYVGMDPFLHEPTSVLCKSMRSMSARLETPQPSMSSQPSMSPQEGAPMCAPPMCAPMCAPPPMGKPPKMVRQTTMNIPMGHSPLTDRMFGDGSPQTRESFQECLDNLKRSLDECRRGITMLENRLS